MNVVITGNAKGIGRALTEKFTSEGHTVIGFDIADGNDIKDASVFSRLIESLKTADVFVNNCLVDQKRVLTRVLVEWRGQQKIVINLGSIATYMHDATPQGVFVGPEYYENKKQLDNLVVKHNRSGSIPKVMNVRPAYVQTDLTAALDCAKIDPTTVANVVYNNVALWKQVKILDIVIGQ